jgi:sulfide:quinone oxidoreductase
MSTHSVPSSPAEPSVTPDPAIRPTRHHQIVIAGGGLAGATVSAWLCRKLNNPDVAVIEPSETHDYQPLWTLVGGGVVPKEKSRRFERDVLPRKSTWLQESVTQFDPLNNQVVLGDGSRVGYDFLIVAVGIQLNWTAIRGMSRTLVGQEGICSNYLYDGCEGTWQTLQAFRGGTALFTMPPPPIKCAGAPQKIMYLADEHFRRHGLRDKTKIIYAAGTPGIFSVKAYADSLNKVIARKGIETLYKQKLVEIQPGARKAVFQSTEGEEQTVIDYDMIHITPPQGPPDVVSSSPLADGAGWVNVNKDTLQHPDFPNVFALGDASSLPTSKTGAAIRKQVPVVVHNVMATMQGKPTAGFKRYNGYTSCPLVTGYGKLILAEFDYDLKPTETFPFDQTKERWSMYQFKRYGLPLLYWQGMAKGRPV